MDSKIKVSQAVYDGLEVIQKGNMTNSFSYGFLVDIAEEKGFEETALWLKNNKEVYEGIYRGFEPIENEPNQHAAAEQQEADSAMEELFECQTCCDIGAISTGPGKMDVCPDCGVDEITPAEASIHEAQRQAEMELPFAHEEALADSEGEPTMTPLATFKGEVDSVTLVDVETGEDVLKSGDGIDEWVTASKAIQRMNDEESIDWEADMKTITSQHTELCRAEDTVEKQQETIEALTESNAQLKMEVNKLNRWGKRDSKIEFDLKQRVAELEEENRRITLWLKSICVRAHEYRDCADGHIDAERMLGTIYNRTKRLVDNLEEKS